MKRTFSLLASVLMLLPLFSCTKENQTTIEKTWVVSVKENPGIQLGKIPAEYAVIDLSEAGKLKLGIVLTAEMADSFNKEAGQQTIAKENDVVIIKAFDVTISPSGKSSGTLSYTEDGESQTVNYSKMTRTYVELSFQSPEDGVINGKLHTPKSIGLRLGGFIELFLEEF
ncbi:MAG: hypothetical protein SO114_05380 [Candidatus Cryptobacteroides sp.]|nr:hypothetical protein [Candidatus Cryptobacteroides sp.]